MSDPTRLTQMTQMTDDVDVTASELELIRAGREARLSPQHKQRIWMGISAISTSASAAAATAASGGAVLTAVKATILVAALGGGSIVGYQAWQHRERPAAVAPAKTATLAPAPTGAATVPETRDSPPPQRPAGRPAAAAAAPRSPSSGVRKAQGSRLAAEGGVVLEARRDLREGRPEDALRLLDAASTEFAAGALVQEREALAIEALSRSGRREAARARAAAFLRAYPGSPHAASVKTFAGP